MANKPRGQLSAAVTRAMAQVVALERDHLLRVCSEVIRELEGDYEHSSAATVRDVCLTRLKRAIARVRKSERNRRR